jgi:hypothetical protein
VTKLAHIKEKVCVHTLCHVNFTSWMPVRCYGFCVYSHYYCMSTLPLLQQYITFYCGLVFSPTKANCHIPLLQQYITLHCGLVFSPTKANCHNCSHSPWLWGCYELTMQV